MTPREPGAAAVEELAARVRHIVADWSETMRGDDVRSSVVRGMAVGLESALPTTPPAGSAR